MGSVSKFVSRDFERRFVQNEGCDLENLRNSEKEVV